MPRRSRAQSLTIPPPVLGWNTKDPLSTMDQTYAVEVINYFSDGSTVDARKGYTAYATGIGGGVPVPLLIEFPLQNGTRKFVAVSGGYRPFNISSSGAGVDLSTGGTFIGGPSGIVFRNRLFIKDNTGVYDVISWDGAAAAFVNAAFTGPGGDDKLLTNISVYKNRLYFCGKDLSVWYGGVDAITGALTQFDFQSVFTQGGFLYFAGPVNKSGDTNQEYFAAISSTGEILIYQGDNPGSATWGVVGHYYMPPPCGFKAFFYWGSELVIITFQGVVLLNSVINARDGDLVFLSDKINSQFVELISTAILASDISGVYYPKGNFLLISMYTLTNSFVQFVMNTITRSWWRWNGINAQSWGLYNNDLYFGFYGASAPTDGRVYKMWDGYTDLNVDTGASQTHSLKLRPAYNYFDNRSTTKHFTAANVILKESEGLSLTVDADVDYADTTPTNTVTDTSDTSYKLYNAKVGLTGIGKAASIRFEQTVTTKRRSIQAIEVFFNEGDIQ